MKMVKGRKAAAALETHIYKHMYYVHFMFLIEEIKKKSIWN